MAELKKEIKLFDAIMLVAGSMIGSGIFIVSADVARQVGSSGWLLAAWALAGVLTLIGAVCYTELAGMFPTTGGQYVFLQKTYGNLVGFLYGWAFFAVIQTGTIAAVAVAFSKYFGVLLPDVISDKIVFFSLGNTSIQLTSQRLVAILSIVLLTFINTKGVKLGKIVQNFFSSTKIIALILIIIFGLWLGFNPEVFQLNFSNIFEAKQVAKGTENGLMNVLSPFGILIALGVCQVGTLFSSDAWNNITMIGGEVKNPEKTLTRGLIFGTLLVTILYLLINIVYLCILPLQGVEAGATIMERGIQFASEDRVAAAAASLIGGNTFTIIIAILIMISTFGCNNGLIIMGARTSYKMAEEGMFFQKFKKINKALVPSVALWGQCFWASMLCISGQYGNLLDYIMGVVILFYILTIFGIFVLRRTMPDAPRPIKVPLYPFLPILYIVLASVILFILMSEKPQYTYPGILIVLLGVPLFYWFRKSK